MSNFLAFTNYITLEKKYSKHTILAYSKDLNLFSVFCLNEFGSVNIEDCNYSQIRVWIVFLLDSGLSNRSVNRKLASLKSYYNGQSWCKTLFRAKGDQRRMSLKK